MTSTVAVTLDRASAGVLAETENQRFADLARALVPADWSMATDCPGWDVRAVAGHVLGMWEFASSLREFVHAQTAGYRAARGRPLIDGITEAQVADRAHLTPTQVRDRLTALAPRAARARRRLPAPARFLPIRQRVASRPETWRLGYLFDVILTRDTWMHRIDIARATGRPLVLTAGHDGRIVADVVAEWARRHGSTFQLILTGPAGGTATRGAGGEEIILDAVDFCRILSGRGSGTGLLTQRVPF